MKVGRPQIDLTDLKIGLWQVEQFLTKKGKQYLWLCRCKCGRTKAVNGHSLRNGLSHSCGCARKRKRFRIQTNRERNLSMYQDYINGEHIEDIVREYRVSRSGAYSIIKKIREEEETP